MVKAAYETFKKLPRYLRTEDLPTHTFTPRTYQLDLLDAALAQNTIVCLNSASSKMFITVMLIKEVSKQVRRPWLVQEGKRIIYLASSAYYVEHHARVIAHHTDLTVGQYAEETTTAGWEEEAWVGELNNHQVLVMTAPILLKLLVFKYLHLSSMNLLIVDENHGVVKNPNHIEIMDYYKTCPDKDKPKIVVLTASLLTNKCKDPVELKNTISLLEHTFHCTAETSTLVFSERHGTSPKEIVYECESREDPTNLTPVIASVLENALLFVYECSLFVDEDEGEKDPRQIPKTALSECLNILYELGPWCANHVSEMLVKQIEKLEQHENIDLNKHFLRFTATQLRLVSKIFEQYFTPDYLVDELLHYVSPKVVKLVTVLRKYRPEVDFMIIREDDDDGDDMMGSSSDMSDESSDMSDSDQEDSSSSSKHHKPVHIAIKYPHCQEDSTSSELLAQEEEKRLCGLIFVERKYVAYALNKVIEEICAWDEELCFVKSYHITGQGYRGNSSKKESSISHRRHEEILRKFRMQDLNLLIATSSLEERIDIPKCNLVVRFDSPKDYRSYSHSKARARARNAEFVMLIDKPKADVFTAELKTYKGIEQVLLGRCKEEEEILLPEAYHVSSPSLVKADDSHQPITMFSAISVINRYCAKLPSDAFTHLTPKCTVEEVMKEKQCCYVARLKLPINSPKKEELKGQLMPTPKYAKMVVALEMCKLLQQQGELDNNFLPVGKEIFKYEDKDSELEEEEEAIGCPRPGTTKRKQYYFKKAADALLMSHPSKSKPCKLYNIRMTLTGPITEEQNTRGRKIYVPENTPQGFGILSSKFIPQVPCFPVYTRSGEVTVFIELLRADVNIDDKQLQKLLAFHKFVFSTVLRLEKDPIDFTVDASLVGYIVVPLNKNFQAEYAINWQFVQQVESSFSKEKQNIYDPKRETFQFCMKDFEDAVVMPSYRNVDQPQHFYVAEIRHDLNPKSQFPSPELYRTFDEYYTKKYGLFITNMEQPLLDVDHTSARLNLLTPRYMNQKGIALPTSSAETKKARRENLQQKQILIPELCVVHVFPASLWRKAVCLPAILYRMNYLLIAEEIRVRIAQGTKIGLVKLPDNFQFSKLDFGFETNPKKLKNEIILDESKVEPRSGNCNVCLCSESLLEELTNGCANKDRVGFQNCSSLCFSANSEVCSFAGCSSICSASNKCFKINYLKEANLSSNKSSCSDSKNAAIHNEISGEDLEENCAHDKKLETRVEDFDNKTEFHQQNIVTTKTEEKYHKVKHVDCKLKNGECVNGITRETLYQDTGGSNGLLCFFNHLNQTGNLGGLFKKSNFNLMDSRESQDRNCLHLNADNSVTCQRCLLCDMVCRKNAQNAATEGGALYRKTLEQMKCDIDLALVSQRKQEQVACKVLNSKENRGEKFVAEACKAISNERLSDVRESSHLVDAKDIKNFMIKKPKDVDANKKTDEEGGSKNDGLLQEKIIALNSDLSICALESKTIDKMKVKNSEFVECSCLDSLFRKDHCTTSKCNIHQCKNTSGEAVDHGESVVNSTHCKRYCTNCRKKIMSVVVREANHHKQLVPLNDAHVCRNCVSIYGCDSTAKSKLSEGCSTHACSQKLKQSCVNTSGTAASDCDNCYHKTIVFQNSEKKHFSMAEKSHCSHCTCQKNALSKKCCDFDFPVNNSALTLSLDEDMELNSYIGPSPCTILQALTMSNANDFFSLERLETIGDSFLKYAITVYLYCTYPGIHEGKLSYLRSKQVSNYNLYRLGRKKGLPERMVSTKFEPYENWLPPGYVINESKRRGPVPKVLITASGCKTEKPSKQFITFQENNTSTMQILNRANVNSEQWKFNQELEEIQQFQENDSMENCLIPFSLQTQHSIPDKSVADCVEALIGCYLTSCGKKAALLFMSWLGLKVLPKKESVGDERIADDETLNENQFEELQCPPSPLLTHVEHADEVLEHLLDGYYAFEEKLGYRFKDRSYLLQAFTHASYHYNTVTDCYQRLEFLGDAILDYVITRHLYEDSQKYSPGVLTDLRSALVNNNIFAALAVKWDFHKYFKAVSPDLFYVIERFVSRQKEKEDEIDIDGEEEDDTDEEVVELEIPKALGDIFESVAGAIYLDSGMSLDVVWKVYYHIMKPQIDKYLKSIPKSPVRELLEMEPETAKFEKPERTVDGKIRVTVNVVGKGVFSGIGRNYRIAKSAAAKKALRVIKTMQAQGLF